MAVIAVLLLALAGWAALATCRTASSVPGDAAWKRAAAIVRAGYQRGDLIAFAPEWIDPVGRMHLGDLLSVDDAARMDAARFARVWVVSIRGARSTEVAGERPALAQTAAGVEVQRFDRTPVVVLDTAMQALATAKSSGAMAMGPSAVLAEVGFTPRRCVQVVPAAGGAVTIEFPGFELGTQLVGYVGLADVFTRRDVREPGQLELQIGGRKVAEVTAGIDDGWVRFSATTQPGRAAVTVIARSPSPGARDRRLCFAMESRR
jgi:hypothetical protein